MLLQYALVNGDKKKKKEELGMIMHPFFFLQLLTIFRYFFEFFSLACTCAAEIAHAIVCLQIFGTALLILTARVHGRCLL